MVLETVKSIIIDQLKVSGDDITLETDLINDLDADSLNAVEIIMAIEDEYEITIPDEEAEKMRTVGDIVKYLELRV
ncbi:MAG: acyl carrier protein [Firmicutes bacterium]|nr:acyl carrier protein [Bacillota bacterium]